MKIKLRIFAGSCEKKFDVRGMAEILNSTQLCLFYIKNSEWIMKNKEQFK